MTLSENLFNNLLVVGILGSLVVIIYCKIKKKTLTEVIQEVREGFTAPVGPEYYE